MSNNLKFLTANWSAPKHIKTLITTRIGGKSFTPFDELNLATHVGDNLDHVMANRKLLLEYTPSRPYWLNQNHSKNVLNLDSIKTNDQIDQEYDASFTSKPNQVCSIMTADCIPIFLTDLTGTFVAAIHAGWRGVLDGIISSTLGQIKIDKSNIIVYIGPSICPKHFEVEKDLLEKFRRLSKTNQDYFNQRNSTKYECDLVGIAKLQLNNAGILDKNITLSNLCTYCNEELFFSFRRDGITGRIAHLIWIDGHPKLR